MKRKLSVWFGHFRLIKLNDTKYAKEAQTAMRDAFKKPEDKLPPLHYSETLRERENK
jgi:hypothetical protein